MADKQPAAAGQGLAAGAQWGPWHGDALRELRVQRGLRQQELADAVGQPRTVLSNWENGIRSPGALAREKLAAVLDVPVSALDQPPPLEPQRPPDRWSALRARLHDLVPEQEAPRLDRFVAQTELFAALADNELAAVRWNRLHAAVRAFRDDIAALGSAPASSDGAQAIGRQLASQVRTQLDLSNGPLPALDVAADRCGAHVFVVYLSAGPAGRMRAAGREHDGLGVSAMVNAAMDGSHRLYAFCELLGQLLLDPAPAACVVAARRGARGKRPSRSAAASAFAAELVLPAAAARRDAELADAVGARGVADGEALLRARAAALTGLVQTYRAPLPVALSQLDRAWRLKPDQRQAIHAASLASGWQPSSVPAPAIALGRATVQDVPARLLVLLAGQVQAGRASAQGAAELLGMDVSELRDLLARRTGEPSGDDDGWLDGPGSAVA